MFVHWGLTGWTPARRGSGALERTRQMRATSSDFSVSQMALHPSAEPLYILLIIEDVRAEAQVLVPDAEKDAGLLHLHCRRRGAALRQAQAEYVRGAPMS